MEAFAAFLGRDFDPFGFRLLRTELMDENLTPLLLLGTEF